MRKNNTTGNPTAWNEDDKISPREIYDSLWRCRDFEISHLWQRSIFLTAFILMCFTGYATLIIEATEKADATPIFYILCAATMIAALLGYTFSVLWVKMAKGSKLWYERYENTLYKIERDPKYSQCLVYESMDEDNLMHGSLQEANEPSDSLKSTSAGAYSVSRINVIIGQVLMCVWFLLYVVVIALLLCYLPHEYIVKNGCWLGIICIYLVMGAVLLLPLYFVHHKIANHQFAHSS